MPHSDWRKACARRASPARVYPESAKMKKQMEYANRRGVPYVAILGSDELAAGTVTVKNMGSGEQQSIAQAELINLLK